MRQFTLKQLRYFATAGELLSVTLAAKKLHVSQPSISAAIQQIEDMSGLQLFVRHHAQGLSLTSSGQQFLVRARQLLIDADGLNQFAHSLSEEITGELRLVAFPTFAPIFLPKLLRRYADLYPQVSLSCHEMTQIDVIKGINNGNYELAFTYDLQIPDNISFTPLSHFPPYVVVAEDHPLSQFDSVSLEALTHYPMAMLDWQQSREYFLSLFSAHGLTPNVAYRAKSFDMIRGLVANGFGFSILNTPLNPANVYDGLHLTTIPLKEPSRPLSMGMACLKELRLSPAAEALQQLALQTDILSLGTRH